jgi:predicted GNAT family acetyltransferase
VRLLSESDVPVLREVLNREPYYNLFMIGDLEWLGISSPELFYWGQFVDDQLVGVAMRYKRNWHFYDASGADLSQFAQAIDLYPEDATVNGRDSLVEGIMGHLQQSKVLADHRSTYCALPNETQLAEPRYPTRRATDGDVDALVDHYVTAGEMRRDGASIRTCLAHNRIFVTEVEGQIVSAALTNVETRSMAMIGGVFTPEPLRGRGYASAAMTALCASLLSDGCQPCLFYDNPAAGVIYRRLGFEDIGPWRLVCLEHQP